MGKSIYFKNAQTKHAGTENEIGNEMPFLKAKTNK